MKIERKYVYFRDLYLNEPKFKKFFDENLSGYAIDWYLNDHTRIAFINCYADMGTGITPLCKEKIEQWLIELDNESTYDNGYSYDDVVYAHADTSNKKIYLLSKKYDIIKVMNMEKGD